MECNMAEPSVLRSTKIGNGFVKEDVLAYLDELNSKIEGLEKELKEARGAKGAATPAQQQELIEKTQLAERLQEKLNATNNALRAARKENDELKQQIERMKVGGAAAAGGNVNPQAQQALEAAKKEIDNLKNQLKAAEQKTGGANVANPQAKAALEAAKKEIDSLRNQLKAAEKKSPMPAGNPAADAELAKAKAEITKINSDLQAKIKELTEKNNQLSAKTKESADKDGKIAELEMANKQAAAENEKKITELNKRIEELKDASNNPTLAMNALFVAANETVTKLKADAQREANEKIVAAAEEAKKTVDDANEKAKKTIDEADEKAKKTVDEANAKAEKTIADAKAEAEKTTANAKEENKSINELSKNVRTALLTEIENLNTKFNDINAALSKLSAQADESMSEAKKLVDDAKKTVDSDGKIKLEIPKFVAPSAPILEDLGKKEEKKAPAPVKKEEPKPEVISQEKAAEAAKSADPFAAVQSSGYNNANFKGGKGMSELDDIPPVPQLAKPDNSVKMPDPVKLPEPPKPAPKKAANFNFDMAELLKEAEEAAAKNPQ